MPQRCDKDAPAKPRVPIAACLNNAQDGRSSALTAPNGPAQSEVLKAALQDARMGPEALAGLGMHGTATPLGDPIGGYATHCNVMSIHARLANL